MRRFRLGARRPPGLFFAAALALGALAAWPMLSTPGLVNTRAGGDSPFLLLRLYEMQVNLRAGVLPARWMPDAAYGLGYPFFNYYASLPYYLGAGLSLAGAGILWGLKLTQLLGFLAAAGAMYVLARDLFADRAGALLAAAAYTFAPFHMVNVYVRGDSLCEFYAFVFYPLVLWGIQRLRRSTGPGSIALVALAYGGLVLTHNISALIFTPLAIAAVIGAALTAGRRRAARVLLAGAAGLLLGLGLSAWYWAPALLEHSAVSLADMTTGYFHYAGHFRGANLVQPSLFFDYGIGERVTPFVLGGLQAALAALALAVLAVRSLRARRLRGPGVGLALLLGYAIWPITPASAWLWAHAPLLPMIQFPWRFLSLAALATALVVAAALPGLPRRGWIAGLLSLLLAASALALLRPEPCPLGEADVTAPRLQLYEHLTGNVGSTVRAEWLPPEAVPRPFTSASLLSGEPHPPPRAAEGSLAAARLVSAGPTWQEWDVTVDSSQASLVLQTYAFPGWQATVDGSPVPIESSLANGRIALRVPGGQHRLALRLGRTPLRAAAEQSSLAAALIAAGLAVAGLVRAPRAWVGLALAGAVAAATVGGSALLGRTPARAAGTLATETMDFIRLPYLHPSPQGVSFGAARLLGYELSTREAMPGEGLCVRVHWQVGARADLRAVVRLTSAAEPLFGAPGHAASECALDSRTEHCLTVPAELAPGLALLAVEVRSPEGALAPRTAHGAERGTIYLTPVRVAAPAPDPLTPPVASLGPAVELVRATARQVAPERVAVHLTWRARQGLPEDYVASVRLLDARGVRVAALDVQPRYGLYPTSLWPAGVPVADYYELRLPRGTPPDSDYQLEVVLYQARTLKALGSARIGSVAVEQPSVDREAPLLASFADGPALTAWRLEREEVQDGEELVARAQWTAPTAPLPNVLVRLSLRDRQGREVAAREEPLSSRYQPGRWPQHVLVNARLALRVPPGTPAGSYRLLVEVRAVDGRELGRWSPSGEVRVRAAARRTELPTFSHPVGVDFGGLFRLAGYDLERSGDELLLTLHWQALRAPGRDYKVFVHCFDPTREQILAQRDAQPLDGRYPTGQWAAGEVVSDRLVVDLADVPPGRYLLAVGWYDPVSGQRLPAEGDAGRISDGRLLLEEVSL